MANASDPAFYQQGADGSQGAPITISDLSFEDRVINGVTYKTFAISSNIKDSIKIFATADASKWNSSSNQLEIQKNSIFTSSSGIAMGNTGAGTLTLDMWTGQNDKQEKSFIMDLSNVSETSYALYGNLAITGSSNGSAQDYSNKSIELRLGGKGIKGNIDIGSIGCTKFVFSSGSNLQGALTITGQGNNKFIFSGNTTTGKIWAKKGTNSFIFDGNATISSGSEVIYSNWYQADSSAGTQNTFIFKGSNNAITNTSGTNGVAISIYGNSGNTTDNTNYNKLLFEAGTNTITGKISTNAVNNGGTYIGKNYIDFGSRTTQNTINGNIEGILNYNIIAFEGGSYTPTNIDDLKTNAKNKIVGTISAKGLSNSSTVQFSNLIYFKQSGYIEGNITGITNGDPSGANAGPKPFGSNLVVFEKMGYIKGNITGTGNNSYNHSNYLIFNDDAKVEGSIDSAGSRILLGNANKTLTITNGVSGTTKIWGTSTALTYTDENTLRNNVVTFFNTNPANATLVGTLNIQNGVKGTLDLRADTITLGNNTADSGNPFALNATGVSTLIAKNGTINGNMILGANTTVQFLASGTADINGNIKATSGTQNITLAGTTTISGNILSGNSNNSTNAITAKALTFDGSNQSIESFGGWTAKNLLTLQGETNFGSNFAIKATNANSGTKKYNIIKFDTGSSLASNAWSISELTASMGETSAQNNGNPINVLSFDQSSMGTVTIGNINKKTTVTANGGKTGYNYIGKSITTGNGSSLELVANLDQNNAWAENTHTADITLIVTNDIYSNRQNNYNYINVATLQANTITSEGGANNIAVGTSAEITGNITASGNGSNNFVFSSDDATIVLKGATNQISTLTAVSSGSNTLTLGNSGAGVNATISTLTHGENLNVVFSGTQTNSLALKGASNSLASITATTGSNTLTLGDASTTTSTSSGSISGSNLDVVFAGDSATLTLEGATNTIKSLDASATTTNKLNLGKAGSAVNANISAITNGGNLEVAFISSEANILTLNDAGATLKSLDTTLGNGTIKLASTVNSLTVGTAPTAIDITNGKTLNFTVEDRTTDLTLANGIDATNATSLLTINDTGDKAVIASGGLTNVDVTFAGDTASALTLHNASNTLKSINATNAGTLTLGNGTDKADAVVGNLIGNNLAVVYGAGTASSLTLQGTDNTIASIDATNAGKLILDTTSNAVTATISNAITGDNFTAQFNGTATNANTLNLNGGKLAIEINSGAVDKNLLTLLSGTTTIAGDISVTTGKGITLSLDDDAKLVSNLSNGANLDLYFSGNNTLTGAINTTAGTTNIIVNDNASATITGKIENSAITQVELKANSTLNLVSNAKLSSITMDATSKLDLSNAMGTHSADNTSYDFAKLSAGGAEVILYSEANKAKVRMDARGASTSSKYYTLLKIGASGNGLVGDSTTFTLHLDNAKYDNVYLGGVAQDGSNSASTSTIANATLFGHTYSDRIIIENGKKTEGGNEKISDIKLKIIPILSELGEVSYQGGGTETEGNIAILTVKDGVTEQVESVQSVEVAGVNAQVSIVSATTDITGKADENGTYTTYFAGSARATSISEGIKEIASTALTVNYDLYLANFNSLNKRMGELRDNPYNQGVWARVYGGAMSNDFGAGSKTEYVTAQGGYDYSLTLGDARNYMGIAIAYGHSTTKSNQIQNAVSNVGVGQATGLQDVNSNMVEVGIYNSYVMDSGWYNDTIFKFDYIMSTFTMTDNTALESETNNFAMILSNEFGYRYKFGKDSSWYIDPQLEIGFGYFNQSDFNRVIFDHINQQSADIKATQDTILTLRSRVGASLGKKFTTDKGFASLYVGAFYEYDYIEGGNANASSFGVTDTINSIESNGRAIVNVGSNIELTDGVRMYIDVEKSFGDKQRTDMQFNFGARYSFGEKVPTISYQEAQKQSTAPLKIEEKKEVAQEQEASSTQETAQPAEEAKQ